MTTNNPMTVITSKHFGALNVDVYQNDKHQYYMTREQIGTALEYNNPNDAIRIIHSRNADRLDPLSTSFKLNGVEGGVTKVRNIITYNLRGVMEICRLSRQPKADAFMDFCWDIMESLMRGDSVLATPKSMDEATIAGKSPNITAPATKPNTYAFHMEDSEWMAELKKNLIVTDKTMCNLKEMYSKVYGDLTAASDEIDDLEHAIEFKTVNAAQGYQLMAELKKARRKRREAKDAKLLLEIVMNTETREWGDGKLETAIEQLESRQFTPKVRKDLFEKN